MDKAAIVTQGFNPTDDTAGNYPVSEPVITGTGSAATFTITVGCAGTGTASYDSDTGIVTPPAS
jgi:hypothetical protein